MDRDIEGTLNIHVDAPVTCVFELPDWFYTYHGSISIKTPYCTSVVHNKQGGTFPFTERMMYRHYVDPEGTEPNLGAVRHDELAPDLVRFKPFGAEERIYRFTITGGDSVHG